MKAYHTFTNSTMTEQDNAMQRHKNAKRNKVFEKRILKAIFRPPLQAITIHEQVCNYDHHHKLLKTGINPTTPGP
jgi:hypothetical protein